MLNQTDLSRTDLNLLVLFQAVLEQGHVGRAAEKLHVSPSAVSHGLRRLRRLLNDPLFLRTPRGVVPTERAMSLAEPVANLLEQVKSVISSAEPFQPGVSTRRFTVGAPDGVSAVFLPPLLETLSKCAPGIDIGIRELLPSAGVRSSGAVWERALAELEARAMDIAVLPVDELPARFAAQTLYDEDFVIAMRAGHPFLGEATLSNYCQMRHLVVSQTADAFGFVDEALEREGRTRRISVTVPNFMMALAMISETDLVAALPRQLVSQHAGRYGVAATESPLLLPRFRIRQVVPKVALMDAGVKWLFGALNDASGAGFD